MKILVVLLVMLYAATGASSLEVKIEPKQIQAKPRSEVNVTCYTVKPEAITHCQFRIWYNGKKEHGKLLNITKSTSMTIVNPFDSFTNYIVESRGTDFKTGTCGVKLNRVAGGQLLVGCKLTTESEASAVKTMSLFFIDREKLELEGGRTEDYNVVAGENVTFRLRTKDIKKPLGKCYLRFNTIYNGTLLEVSEGRKRNTTGRYSAWLNETECGFAIHGVEEIDNGAIYFIAESRDSGYHGGIGASLITIVVKKGPEMQLDKRQEDYYVGESLAAICSMRGLSRSDDVRWTWKLGTEMIRDPEPSDPINLAWRWPWEEVTTSRVHVTLTANDDGKNISCVAGNKTDSQSDFTASSRLTIKIVDEQSWQLGIQPAEFVTIVKSQSVAILCKANPGFKLKDCGFQIAPKDGVHYFKASLGPMSKEDTHFGNLAVKYHGSGLDRGECGVQLTAPDNYQEETFLVGCRARTEFSGWKYNYISVEDSSWYQHDINLQTFPSSSYLLPGSSLTMRCDYYLNSPVQACAFTLPDGQEIKLNKESNTFEPPNNVQYVGKGLDKGHCGIFIPDVSQLDISKSNTLTCELMINRNNFPTRQIHVNIAEPAVSDATLTVSPPEYKSGSELEAKCVTPKSSPPATITWYLDGAPVAPGSANARIREEPVAEWRWRKDAQTATQFLAVTLAEGDDGARFRCEVRHMALAEYLILSLNFVKGTTKPLIVTSRGWDGKALRQETDANNLAPIAIWVWVLVAVGISVAVVTIMITVYQRLKRARQPAATATNAKASAASAENLHMLPEFKDSKALEMNKVEYDDVNCPPEPEPEQESIYDEIDENKAAAEAARSAVRPPLYNVAYDHAKHRLKPAGTGSNRTDMRTAYANLPASVTDEEADGYIVPRARNVK